MAAPVKASKHPFKDAVFLFAVRNRLTRELMAQGASRTDAREQLADLTDITIEEVANKVSGDAPTAVTGPFVDFILQFIQSPLFGQLIALLLSLLGVATPAPAPVEAPPTPPA